MSDKWTVDVMSDDEGKMAEWYYDFSDCVGAALKTCTARRASASGARESGELSEPDRTAGIVAAASAKFAAKDLGAMHDVFAAQALVLDEIFTQYAHRLRATPISFQPS